MTGPIAQLVALVCHGNAFLRGERRAAAFFPGNSTCAFCDRVDFAEVERSFFRGSRERIVAASPDAWFEHLKETGAEGLRLSCAAQDDPRISDRLSAGFIGGGGDWTLAARKPTSVDVWKPRWTVWDRDAPENKIWRVTYGLVGSRARTAETAAAAAERLEGFRSALVRIHAFSQNHGCKGFTECFQRALEALDSGKPLHGHHKDLCPETILPESTRAVLDAAQSAWVFGGMGSWNDMGFEGDAAREYDRVSDDLFSRLRDVICAAANESDRA